MLAEFLLGSLHSGNGSNGAFEVSGFFLTYLFILGYESFSKDSIFDKWAKNLCHFCKITSPPNFSLWIFFKRLRFKNTYFGCEIGILRMYSSGISNTSGRPPWYWMTKGNTSKAPPFPCHPRLWQTYDWIVEKVNMEGSSCPKLVLFL